MEKEPWGRKVDSYECLHVWEGLMDRRVKRVLNWFSTGERTQIMKQHIRTNHAQECQTRAEVEKKWYNTELPSTSMNEYGESQADRFHQIPIQCPIFPIAVCVPKHVFQLFQKSLQKVKVALRWNRPCAFLFDVNRRLTNAILYGKRLRANFCSW